MNARRAFLGLFAAAVSTTLLSGTALASSAVSPPATGLVPGTVFVQTVPALDGVHLMVDSARVTTGPGGTAKVAVADFNKAASRVSLASAVLDARDSVSLVTVKTGPHTGKYESHLTVGLDVTSMVTLQISGGTTGVVPNTVHAIRLHSLSGKTMQVNPQVTPTVNLLSRQTTVAADKVTTRDVTWSVDSLIAAPGVSVTTAQARFDPFEKAIWQIGLLPVAGTVIVDTMPAISGVSLQLEGSTVTTDAKGRAQIRVADLDGVSTALKLGSSEASGSTVSLLRVATMPSDPFQRHLLAALAVSRPVTFGFVDSSGRPIAASRVTEVELNGGGNTVKVPADQIGRRVLLLAEQGNLVNGSWQPHQIDYTVSRATVDGSDAVFAGQQRFDPDTSSNWPIAVSAFEITVTVRDVLFGSRVASAAEVTRPDGVQYSVRLSGDQPTVLRSVVRGQYTLTTRSAVLGANSKILVSKNSDVQLRVVTLPDVLVLAAAILGVSVFVVVLGIRRARRTKVRRAQAET